MTRFQTLNEVVTGLAEWEEEFRSRNDRRCVFLTLYGTVSAEMRDRVSRRAFEDPDWVHRYAVAFANFYRQALEDFEAGSLSKVPMSWRISFETARDGRGLVLQDVLLGVNAHVNNDLPYALREVSIDPDRHARYRDHSAVNAVLGAVTERAILRLASLYAPGLAGMDECAGEVDEIATAFSLEVARESAWESAVALANARGDDERKRVERLIGSRASVLGRLLLAPSLSPTTRAVCRKVESGTGWLALSQALK
jgi:Family of unknown function (DUF5995)